MDSTYTYYVGGRGAFGVVRTRTKLFTAVNKLGVDGLAGGVDIGGDENNKRQTLQTHPRDARGRTS